VMIIQAADAQLEFLLVRSIREAAFAGDWRAAEALLKRRFPERWADRQRIDHHVILDEAKKLAEQYPELSVEEIQAEAEAVLRESRS
jgi:quinol monooxygenase YgiN